MLRNVFVPLIVLLAASSARAEIELMDFQLNGMAASQASGGSSQSGQVSWNPTVGLGPIAVRGNAGVALLKSTFDSKFWSFNAQAFLKYNFLPMLAIEGGGGLQTWVNNGGTHPIYGGNLAFEFPIKLAGLINRVFAGYSRYALPGNATNEFRLGIGIEL